MKVLIAGESWATISLSGKGFAVYSVANYEEGGDPLIKAIEPIADVTYIRNHEVEKRFPFEVDQLQQYDVVILSDCPSDTLLLSTDVFQQSKCQPNRLHTIREYVTLGGGFLMVGGYMSFAGLGAQAKYYRTPIEEILPVKIARYDDRVEAPQGLVPKKADITHPVLFNIHDPWPAILGYNQFEAKPDSTVLLTIEEDPFLVLGRWGLGHTAAYASDCSPHWAPKSFLEWESYASFWQQLISWLATKSTE